ncbi:hypothetical protein GCM10009745_52060 [Kribbella yunnanensis]|uniref:DUF4352 domain-containing protein n=2 Tax=Kribbella yunnanensis TaxID=190194 RepID=A0ABN2I6F1_9ACTN
MLVVAAGGWFLGVRHGDGPLGDSGRGSKVCAPAGESVDATVGHMYLRNGSSAAVRITAVELIGARNLENAGAFLVPDPMESGSKSGWDFGDGPFTGDASQVRLAVDAELAGKAETSLVVHVQRPDVLGEGYLEGVRVEYTTGLRRYAYETGPEHIFRPGKC